MRVNENSQADLILPFLPQLLLSTKVAGKEEEPG
jgi:hypothetical protein